MKDWNEIRSAACVVRVGTISAAADELGVHRATVVRYIDHLEEQLGAKLFRRHRRGFSPTDLAHEVVKIADATADQFGQLKRKAQTNRPGLSGEVKITAPNLFEPVLMPVFRHLRSHHPDIQLKFVAANEILRLELAEADIAFRLGPRPQEPSNVVIPYRQLEVALFATRAYIDERGLDLSPDRLKQHAFITPSSATSPYPMFDWLYQHSEPSQRMFQSESMFAQWTAIAAGLGVGLMPVMFAESQTNLVKILSDQADWQVPSWIVTHGDVHRTARCRP